MGKSLPNLDLDSLTGLMMPEYLHTKDESLFQTRATFEKKLYNDTMTMQLLDILGSLKHDN